MSLLPSLLQAFPVNYMGLLAKYARAFLKPILILAAIALLSGALAAYAAFKDLRNRASLLAGSLTGMKCLIASVGPCFPCGIKASDITMCSASGVPLFQAKEMRTQVNLLRYLQKNRKQSDLFDTLHGDHIKLTLTRNESGEWDFPKLLTSQRIRGSAQEGKASRSPIFFHQRLHPGQNRERRGKRFYKSLEADVDPERDSVALKLSGTNESVRITFTKGAVKRYELQGDNFSPALLAPVSAFPLPLENLVLNGT